MKTINQLTIAVTSNCNSRCKHCDIWKLKKNTFTLNEWDKIVSRLKEDNMSFFEWCLCGGEPFLRDDYVDMFKVLHKYFPDVHPGCSTNAFATDLIISLTKQIQEIYPSFTVCVSLDGTPEIHDYIRGTEGGYMKAMETADKLMDMGIDVNLNVTLNHMNIHLIPFFHNLAKFRFAGKLTLSPYTPCGQFFGDNMNKKLILTRKDTKKAISLLKPYLKQEYRVWNLIRFFEGKKKECNAGRTMLNINHNLDVYPCGQAASSMLLNNLRNCDYRISRCVDPSRNFNCIRCFNPVESNHSSTLLSKLHWKLSGTWRSFKPPKESE